MDKLYYVVCEEKGETLFEGRFQGRTRGAAIKFLKEQIGRTGLNGTVFTITEIPVPLIREIVEAIMKGEPVPMGQSAAAIANAKPKPKPERFDAFAQGGGTQAEKKDEPLPAKGTDWDAVRKFYQTCKSPKAVAEKFLLSINTVKARIRREGWAK